MKYKSVTVILCTAYKDPHHPASAAYNCIACKLNANLLKANKAKKKTLSKTTAV